MRTLFNTDYDKKILGQQTAEVRQGEVDKFWFRSNRFFFANGCWYFTTREKVEVGPFETRKLAEHALVLFIDCIQTQGGSVQNAVSIAKQGNGVAVS